MLADDRLGLNNHHCDENGRHEPVQPYENEPIEHAEGRDSLSFPKRGVAPSLNKVAASPQLRFILAQLDPRLGLAFTINNWRILVAHLAKGTIGEHLRLVAGLPWGTNLRRACYERHRNGFAVGCR
jgi:hypothetical protein